MKSIFFVILVFFTFKGYCQEPLITDNVQDKVAIGFPGITISQLNQIKAKFLNYDHIASAKYVFGNYNEMVIYFNTAQPHFHTYYDVLKVISPFYDIQKCYFDEEAACDILNGITNETFFQVK